MSGLHLNLQLHSSLAVMLQHQNILDPVMIVGAQLHRAENTHVGEFWTPVPTGHVECLSQVRCTPDRISVGLAVGPEIMLCILLLKISGRGRKFQSDRVLSHLQIIIDTVCIGDVHIIDPVQQMTVQIDRTDGVQSVKHQFLILPPYRLFIDLKGSDERTVLVGKRCQLQLIQTVKRVLDQTVLQQHTVHGAGGRTRKIPVVFIV